MDIIHEFFFLVNLLPSFSDLLFIRYQFFVLMKKTYTIYSCLRMKRLPTDPQGVTFNKHSTVTFPCSGSVRSVNRACRALMIGSRPSSTPSPAASSLQDQRDAGQRRVHQFLWSPPTAFLWSIFRATAVRVRRKSAELGQTREATHLTRTPRRFQGPPSPAARLPRIPPQALVISRTSRAGTASRFAVLTRSRQVHAGRGSKRQQVEPFAPTASCPSVSSKDMRGVDALWSGCAVSRGRGKAWSEGVEVGKGGPF